MRLRLLDSFIRDGYQTIDQVFEQFHDLRVSLPNLFLSKQQLQEFIENRPHFFTLDGKHQTISNTSVAFRLAIFDLLLLCQEEQSVEVVRRVILARTNVSQSVLVEFASTTDVFIRFLRKYDRIFELSELLPDEDRVMLARGVCDVRKRLFLPRWYFKF